MHDEPSPRAPWIQDSDDVARIVLDLAIHRHPSILMIEELIRELQAPPTKVIQAGDVTDSIHELVGSGLLHRLGNFVFATRAATRAHELAL